MQACWWTDAFYTYSMGLHILCALGPVRWTDIGGANCCYEMMHITSLSSHATFTIFSFPVAGNKLRGRDRLVLTIHTVWACVHKGLCVAQTQCLHEHSTPSTQVTLLYTGPVVYSVHVVINNVYR